MNQGNTLPEPEPEFETGDNKDYKVKVIIDSAIYGQETNNQLSGLYYFISWKSYPKEKNIWEPLAVVIHLWKLISTFYKEYSEKPIATSLSLNSAPPMARPIVPKQKCGHLSKEVNKRVRN